jgi:hypothetical protein
MNRALARSFTLTFVVLVLLLAGCSRRHESEAVADQFVRRYFVQDNVAAAVELTSGSARTLLENRLKQIEAAGVSEPAAARPKIKTLLLETQPVSPSEILYVYSVASDVEVAGMKPVTAKLWLSKEGSAWHVSKFLQEEQP